MGVRKIIRAAVVDQKYAVDALTQARVFVLLHDIIEYSLWHNDTQLFKNEKIYRGKMIANKTEGGNVSSNCLRYDRIYNQMIYK